ncbi:acyltransferase [Maribacter sp. 1_2014MBL_MicDiv]|uniref:acyltransferase n=1 Tax=Maribacter sp. 1_2014MBL_MicDiv TaxID=1644130 RepID=UPI0008F5F94F|nr:acyltransferase [Maribacter sp. 1_2014MBL_MicDiv]APA64690.1 acetyltransferase [Maribacter sp. 1_2014MBL_MicDiv]
MATLNYLWKNRAKFPLGSNHFFRAWAKRVISLPELLRKNRRRRALIRKGALISKTAEIGEIQIGGPKKLFKVGSFSFLGKVNISLHHELHIGNNVCINDGVEILTASHDVEDPLWQHIKAKVTIEDYVWIGTGALILPGVTLGHGCVIGARAVIAKSVAPGQIVVGNPAKPVSKKRSENLNYNPCEFLVPNRAWLVG